MMERDDKKRRWTVERRSVERDDKKRRWTIEGGQWMVGRSIEEADDIEGGQWMMDDGGTLNGGGGR